MPESITPTDTLAFVKALLDYFRSTASVLGVTDNLDLFARSFLVKIVVFIGEAEERPMTVNDIANYTGMARSTVQREVAKLVRLEVLRVERQGRRKVILRGRRTSPEIELEYRRALKRLLDTVAAIRDGR